MGGVGNDIVNVKSLFSYEPWMGQEGGVGTLLAF